MKDHLIAKSVDFCSDTRNTSPGSNLYQQNRSFTGVLSQQPRAVKDNRSPNHEIKDKRVRPQTALYDTA